MSKPGTFRSSDGSAVVFADAVGAWTTEATGVLTDVAHSYGAVITYRELANAIWDRTGIQTRMLLMNWIGQVLEAVGTDAHDRGDQRLTALCVRQDGTVGDGYAGLVGRLDGETPLDPELDAAQARLECYRRYADDLPANGGKPQLTRQEATRRKALKIEKPPAVCPVCRLQLLPGGVCGNCA